MSFDVVIDLENTFFYSDKSKFLLGVFEVLRDDGILLLGDARPAS